MIFDGFQLRQILSRQTTEVELHDGRGFMRGTPISAARALEAIRQHSQATFVGIGSTEAIRYLRPATSTRAGLIAEDCITTTGHRAERKRHHREHCGAYGPEQDRKRL